MKKITAFLIILGFFFIGSISVSAADKPIVLKWGHHFKSDFFIGLASQRIADLVKERTEGAVVIEVFPNAQLGGYFQLMASAAKGNLDIAWTDGGSVGRFYPASAVTEGAYLFESMKQLQNFWSGPIGEKLQQGIYEKANLKCFPMYAYGTRLLTTTKKPIKTPADLKGMRVRSIESKVSLTNIRALGAQPTPVDYAELYLALQQGIVDGQENPITSIYSMKFYEVQKYLMMTNHHHQCIFPVMYKGVWEKLSPEHQKVISEVMGEVVPYSDKMLFELVDKQLKEMKAKGLQVVEPDFEAFQKHAVPIVLKEFEKDWYPNIYDEIKKTPKN